MKFLKKVGVSALSLATAFSTALAIPTRPVSAAEEFRGQLESVDSVDANGNVVNVSYNNGAVTGKITFLENGIFRYNVDPSGEFEEYAEVRKDIPGWQNHTATIQAQSDESDKYSHPDANVSDKGTTWEISTADATIVLDKATAKMSIKNKDGKTIMREVQPLVIGNQTVQSLNTNDDEYFFGGGTQNGRFTHKGKSINIANESGWTDGEVSSPNPFYWSTEGYGVLRNTFQDGKYDFGEASKEVIATTHNESEFDAYYFVSNDAEVNDKAETLLSDYYEVTGNPLLLPEYAFYLAHLNCYNRDAWEESTDGSGWTLEDGNKYKELGQAEGYVIPEGKAAESLNNEAPSVNAENFKGVINEDTYKYSARAVIDGYEDNDMPLGWFLPNDGYGCGYGQNGYYQKRTSGEDTSRMNEVIDANVENLRKFTEYAEANGVRSGLWTQAALTPEASEQDSHYQGFQTLRDFRKEVNVAGVSALKTDVAWVGQGYSMALNSVKDGYNILATSGKRPNLVSLDGWAGFQRYAGTWTGDQTGGNWEYIRFHIPTYIGQSLAGNPNVGSDVDGIFGGTNLITTRDLQFKTFTPTMLDMDGWGSIPKKPHISTDPYKSINRMYLKLKAQLMPYIYTYAQEAVDGLPMIRAMFLEEPNDYTYGTATQYQYMFGDNFLVAPVYQDTNADEVGNDVRNNIYLPETSDIWIDYFTGKQYSGGQIVNNFDAPIWKLPLFVKNGSIIPMYEENNNPMAVSETNEKGLDKTRRIVEFYPYGETSFDLLEDDGISLDYDEATNERDYGGKVTTHITSKVDGDKATLTIGASKGSYEGYDANRHTTFVVNVSEKPDSLEAKNGNDAVDLREVSSYEEFEAAAANNEAVWFYDETPNLNKYSADDEAFKDTEITTTPKVYVSFTKTNVDDNAQTLVVNGFINDSEALHMKDALNEELSVPTNVNAPEEDKTPTSIKVQWDKVEGATNYEIEVDGIINNVLSATNYNHEGLEYDSEHTYRVRARNVDGYSNWSEPLVTRSLLDPWRNTPKPVNIDWTGRIWGNHNVSLAFDNVLQSGDGGFHSNNGGINETLTVDYGKGYNFETVEYYPRDDAGNGTVTQMEFSTSLDGVNWSETRTFDWTADATVKTIDNVGPARYLRFIPRKSVGTFFSASEIKVSADEGRKPFAIGSIASQHRDYVADADFTNLKNYKGLSVKDNPTFETQIKNYAMDINMNDIYDVYDYTYTLYNLPEGVTNKKEGSATGKGTLVPSVESLSTEETFTIDVILENANNLDALGEVINYNPELLEFVDVTKGDIIESMTDLTVNKVYSDGTAYVNLAYVNRGDQAVCEGSGVAATITMKAKTDIANVRDAIDLSKVSLYGPDVLNSDPGLQPSENALVSTTANSSGAVSAKRAIGPNKESVVTVEFDMVTTLDPNQTNAIVSLGSSDSNYTAYSQMPVVIRMYKDGTFGAHNGSTFVQSNLRFNKNEYYHIKVTIDLEAKKWSAIVSDEAGKETVIADNYGFRSTAQVPENIGKIYLVNNEAQAGKFWLENIKLYDGETDTSINFGLDDFDITMTNEFLPNDDGSNVEKLIQNGKNNGYTKLFDGNKEGSSARDFELLWDIESNYVDGKLPEYIALPLTMHLDLKEDALVDQVKVYNANKANGYLTSAKAQLVYTDGTKGEEVVISDMQSVYEFNFDSAKDVDRIDITFLTAIKADGTAVNNMLTLAEIEATGHLATTEEDKLINSAVTNVEAIDNGSDSADRMFDGSLTTYWESPWSGAQATLPKDVVMTLNDVYSLDTLEFISHTIRNGGITKYEVYTSTDEENWTKVAEGTVDAEEYKQGKNVTVSVAMAGVNAKYVKLVALESVGRIESEDNMYARIAEMNLYGTKAEIIEVDKTALSEAIIAAEALNESDYTADSWAVLANALITAKEILTNEEATQVDVDAAKDALLIAIDALLPNTHKEALEIALELANKITEHDLENVVPAVVEEFIAARAEADEVYNDAKASQEQINKAFDRLAKAMHMLDFIKGDKTALKAFIDKVEGLKDSKDQYTQASWDALEEVLAKAVGVYDNPNAMQEEVNNAYKELVTAF
ncbi:MAG: discoidin domain-containing protein, partial [Thomasclavelia spiroformis]